MTEQHLGITGIRDHGSIRAGHDPLADGPGTDHSPVDRGEHGPGSSSHLYHAGTERVYVDDASFGEWDEDLELPDFLTRKPIRADQPVEWKPESLRSIWLTGLLRLIGRG